MELIFLYINHSKSGFIDKQGINLNSQYYFEVTYEEEKYILFQKKKTEVKHSGFFDDSDCISNVTAIVGENGSGKTTLLNCISTIDRVTSGKIIVDLGMTVLAKKK